MKGEKKPTYLGSGRPIGRGHRGLIGGHIRFRRGRAFRAPQIHRFSRCRFFTEEPCRGFAKKNAREGRLPPRPQGMGGRPDPQFPEGRACPRAIAEKGRIRGAMDVQAKAGSNGGPHHSPWGKGRSGTNGPARPTPRKKAEHPAHPTRGSPDTPGPHTALENIQVNGLQDRRAPRRATLPLRQASTTRGGPRSWGNRQARNENPKKKTVAGRHQRARSSTGPCLPEKTPAVQGAGQGQRTHWAPGPPHEPGGPGPGGPCAKRASRALFLQGKSRASSRGNLGAFVRTGAQAYVHRGERKTFFGRAPRDEEGGETVLPRQASNWRGREEAKRRSPDSRQSPDRKPLCRIPSKSDI